MTDIRVVYTIHPGLRVIDTDALDDPYEVHTVCPYCGKEKTVEVGLPAGSKTKPAVSKRSIWR